MAKIRRNVIDSRSKMLGKNLSYVNMHNSYLFVIDTITSWSTFTINQLMKSIGIKKAICSSEESACSDGLAEASGYSKSTYSSVDFCEPIIHERDDIKEKEQLSKKSTKNLKKSKKTKKVLNLTTF